MAHEKQRFIVEITILDPYAEEGSFTSEHLVDTIEVGMRECDYGLLGQDFELEVV